MGKAKKRIIHKGKNELFTNITRAEAIMQAAEMLATAPKEAYSIITLFGLSAEELLEAGAAYEAVKGMENILK